MDKKITDWIKVYIDRNERDGPELRELKDINHLLWSDNPEITAEQTNDTAIDSYVSHYVSDNFWSTIFYRFNWTDGPELKDEEISEITNGLSEQSKTRLSFNVDLLEFIEDSTQQMILFVTAEEYNADIQGDAMLELLKQKIKSEVINGFRNNWSIELDEEYIERLEEALDTVQIVEPVSDPIFGELTVGYHIGKLLQALTVMLYEKSLNNTELRRNLIAAYLQSPL